MLILTRRPGERLCIGENVVVSILAIKGNQVRIGIAAPRDVAIDREEIYERKLADRRGGGSGDPDSEMPSAESAVRS